MREAKGWAARHARGLAIVLCLGLAWALPGLQAEAAPRAAFVIDIRTGDVYAAENAEARLHPASLTKMMTLYLAFEAVERGEIALDAMVTVSPRAASISGSRLGLTPGLRISIRHLIRAVAIRSANDASTALAEAVAGSEEAFVDLMNARAAAMGLTGTSFRNPHGLTAPGHLSTARDMSVLGRRLHWDFPDYWALFRRRTVDAGLATVAHTNRRFLSAYAGADGIKTGYTRAAGFNLTASAERGGVHLIATVFGAPSSEVRAARAGALLDRAFAQAARVVTPIPPGPLRETWKPEHAPPELSAGASGRAVPAPWFQPTGLGGLRTSPARPLIAPAAADGAPENETVFSGYRAGGVPLTGLLAPQDGPLVR